MPLTRWLAVLARGLHGLRARHAALAAAAALLFMPHAANALCVLACSCNTTITNVVFSPYNPLAGSNDDSTGSIKVSCGGTAGLLIPYTVSLTAGSSSSFSARQMSSGGNKLLYNLYSSVLYAQVLGDGTAGTATLSGGILLDAFGLGTAQTFTLYGRIPAGQTTVVPGSFSDTLTVTLTYN